MGAIMGPMVIAFAIDASRHGEQLRPIPLVPHRHPGVPLATGRPGLPNPSVSMSILGGPASGLAHDSMVPVLLAGADDDEATDAA